MGGQGQGQGQRKNSDSTGSEGVDPGEAGSEEEQGEGRVVRRDAGFSLYPTHRPAWSIHDSVSE